MSITAADAIVVGAGHNGLVAATMLARAGLQTIVLEDKPIIGGATRTERPFRKAPNLAASTASYLLGVMPPELITRLGANIELIRRDPHYFLPTLDSRYLLFGSDKSAMREQFLTFFSENDWQANEALNTEIGQIRDDLGPSWLEQPLSLEATAERYIRPALRDVFMRLVTEPVENYLNRFGFESELLVAMYAVTDGFSGLCGSFGTPATGMNFLVHNMCRLPGSDGTFMIVKGGMGAVSGEFARLFKNAGGSILCNAGVERIDLDGNTVTGVTLRDGRQIRAGLVLCNADPFRMRKMVGEERLPGDFNRKLDNFRRNGTTMKVNLALSRLPTFTCLPEMRGQHGATIHLLPQVEHPIEHIRRGFQEVQAGRFADFPTIEWYTHTTADPTLRDAEGHHNAAFFVQWVPYEPAGSSWEAEETRYVNHLIDIADRFAPGFRDSVIDTHVLTPKKIESEIGISYGHIHHVDNTFGFDQRMPYATPVQGLYSCSGGCHPAGSVVGAAGYNAAVRVMRDMGVRELVTA